MPEVVPVNAAGEPPWTPWMELARQRAHAKDLYEQLQDFRRQLDDRDGEIRTLRDTIETLQRQVTQ